MNERVLEGIEVNLVGWLLATGRKKQRKGESTRLLIWIGQQVGCDGDKTSSRRLCITWEDVVMSEVGIFEGFWCCAIYTRQRQKSVRVSHLVELFSHAQSRI